PVALAPGRLGRRPPVVRLELLALDRVEELPRFRLAQLLRRFARRRAVAAPRHGADRLLIVPLVARPVHLAAAVGGAAGAAAGALVGRIGAEAVQRDLQIPLGRGVGRLGAQDLFVGVDGAAQRRPLLLVVLLLRRADVGGAQIEKRGRAKRRRAAER